MLDVLLVKLNYREVPSGEREFDLGTAYLASSLRRTGFTVEIIDASLEELSYEQLLKRITEAPARIIGLSVWLHRLLRDAEQLIADLRTEGITSHISMGGHSATFLYEEILKHNPSLDSVVCGEGELTVVEFTNAVLKGQDWRSIKGVASISAGRVQYEARPAMCLLDDLAPPALDYVPLVSQRGQYMTILTSRGCYGRCTFCSTGPFYRLAGGKAWRAHSPERVVQELERLSQEHGFTHFGIRDDNFVGPGAVGRERARAIALRILGAGLKISFNIACRVNDIDRDLFALLKQAGLARVFLGVESGSQRRLDGFNKGVTVLDNLKAIELLTELKIPFTVGYIMFAPDTSWSELRESASFLKQALGSVMGINEAVHDMFNPLELLPGTSIARELQERGLLLGDYHGYRYRFSDWRIRAFYQGLLLFRKLNARFLRRGKGED